MIITHTTNAKGERRIYLGGKSSLECWIEPRKDNSGWTLQLDEAVAGIKLTSDERRQWALTVLIELAHRLDVPPNEIAAVPFEAIAELHTSDPFLSRRIASPKRRVIENGFTSVGSAPPGPRPHSSARRCADARKHR